MGFWFCFVVEGYLWEGRVVRIRSNHFMKRTHKVAYTIYPKLGQCRIDHVAIFSFRFQKTREWEEWNKNTVKPRFTMILFFIETLIDFIPVSWLLIFSSLYSNQRFVILTLIFYDILPTNIFINILLKLLLRNNNKNLIFLTQQSRQPYASSVYFDTWHYYHYWH